MLILTLARQIHAQSQQEHLQGVSHWLFLGQIAASIGFIIYSWMLRNWVFITTSSLILLTAIIGQIVLWRRLRAAGTDGRKD